MLFTYMRTIIVSLFVVFSLATAAVPPLTHGAELKDILTGGELKRTTSDQGTGIKPIKLDPSVLVIRIINYALGFLGLLAVALVIYAGFLWMTAAGEEDRVEDAQKTLKYALVGLAIILSAYGLTQWAFSTIVDTVIKQETY